MSFLTVFGVCDLGSERLRESAATGGSAEELRLVEAAREACFRVSRDSRGVAGAGLLLRPGTGDGVVVGVAASEAGVSLDDGAAEGDALAASSPFRRNDSLVILSFF